MPFCIRCGKELHDNAQFCFYCGAKTPCEKTTVSTYQPSKPVYVAPPINKINPDSNITKLQEKTEPKKEIPVKRIVVICVCVFVLVMFLGWLIFTATDKTNAKNHAKNEVEEAWQEFDESLELIDISYDKVTVRKFTEQEINDYVNKHGNFKITDINGNEYDTYWEYWESKNYDPYNDTYKIYTVKGQYQVSNHKNQNYKGWYTVKVLHIVNENNWSIEKTELELPEELKKYVTD